MRRPRPHAVTVTRDTVTVTRGRERRRSSCRTLGSTGRASGPDDRTRGIAVRTAHRNRKTRAPGAAVLTALLSVTACGPGGTDDGADTVPSAAPSTTVSTRPGGGAGGGPRDPGDGSDKADGSGGTGGGDAATASCADADVPIAAEVHPRDEARHLLLTATSTGDEECALHRSPVVRFDDGPEDRVGPMESGTRDVTVGPGGKAYAVRSASRPASPTAAVPPSGSRRPPPRPSRR
ncbi:hypothetical protein GCM10010266_04500 [Streptomyces griseomycini]|nr:hypothetical protein GCM10010266_04500 [Streptomyces griseomycini]